MKKLLYLSIISLILISCNNKPKTVISSTEQSSDIPEIVYSINPDYVTLYNKTWDLAKEHIKSTKGLPQSPYVDEAFDENTIWIWDTAFMIHFFKYAPP